jgi:hypothetical protein
LLHAGRVAGVTSIPAARVSAPRNAPGSPRHRQRKRSGQGAEHHAAAEVNIVNMHKNHDRLIGHDALAALNKGSEFAEAAE